MSVSEDLINFDIIETHKENIQSLPGGRSARSLVSIFSPSPLNKFSSSPTPNDTKNLNDTIRQEFELELQAIGESDDPLDIYDRYVKWTLNAYPSAQATPQSQLLPLLERATKAFLSSSHYKNDPRYLKLWLHYVRFFSDSPRETFAFLARHSIGEGLALFYEEFAVWLEGAGRWTQAEEVYKLGLEREARPAERLLRKFGEFQHRFEQRPQNNDEPSSPALPTVRPALAAKIDPFASSTPRPADPQAPRPPNGVGSSTSRSGRPKLAIFSDADGSASGVPPQSDGSAKGWENIGSLQDRKKENTIEAKPWVGETLKTGKRVGAAQKMTIFKDGSSRESESIAMKKTLHDRDVGNPKTGRVEHVFVDLEAVYPNPDDPNEEMCFEELRAMHRGWMKKDWREQKPEALEEISGNARRLNQPPGQVPEGVVDVNLSDQLQEKLVVEDDMTQSADVTEVKEGSREGRPGRPKMLKVREIKAETQTVKTNLESPTGPKLKRKNSAEPTMTFHTRAATDEIYSIFNQPLKSEVTDKDNTESGCESDDDEDDYTSAGESTDIGRISGTNSELGDETGALKNEVQDKTRAENESVSEWSEFTASKHVPRIEESEETGDSDPNRGTDEMAQGSDVGTAHSAEDLVTPTVEEAEQSPFKTRYVPIPPEDYEPPRRPYRDPEEIAQNRLPFMTPIVEKTESSLAPSTLYQEKGYFNSKTPSRSKTAVSTPEIPEVDNLLSSPFQEVVSPKKSKSETALSDLSSSGAVKKLRTFKQDTEAEKKVRKGPIIKDLQCNPVEDAIRTTILTNLHSPLCSYDGYHDQSTQTNNRGVEIRRYTKAVAKMSKAMNSDKTQTNLFMPPVLSFEGADRTYSIKRELGKGAFAPVYLAESVNCPDAESDDEEVERSRMGCGVYSTTRRAPFSAIKMEHPPTAWEFYIIRTLHRRLGHLDRASASIVNAYEMHLFQDEGFLVEEYRDQGTLLDLVNLTRFDPVAGGSNGAGPGLDEGLVMFFAIEIFRVVESAHKVGILHGDLKADNFLVRFDQLPNSEELDPQYSRSGSGGWASKGLTLIDFGRGIDMRQFDPKVQFIADWKTGPQDCSEMRELRPWTYQVDYFGLAGVLHSVLFGRYIDTVVVDKGLGGIGMKTYKIKEGLKRYWQTDLWGHVFGLLLNPCVEDAGEGLPRLKGMRECRERMETWLEENSERRGLRGMVRRCEVLLKERERRK